MSLIFFSGAQRCLSPIQRPDHQSVRGEARPGRVLSQEPDARPVLFPAVPFNARGPGTGVGGGSGRHRREKIPWGPAAAGDGSLPRPCRPGEAEALSHLHRKTEAEGMLITVLVPSLRANLRTVCTDFSSIDREECRNVKCKGHRVENFNYDCYWARSGF